MATVIQVSACVPWPARGRMGPSQPDPVVDPAVLHVDAVGEALPLLGAECLRPLADQALLGVEDPTQRLLQLREQRLTRERSFPGGIRRLAMRMCERSSARRSAGIRLPRPVALPATPSRAGTMYRLTGCGRCGSRCRTSCGASARPPSGSPASGASACAAARGRARVGRSRSRSRSQACPSGR